MAQHKKNKRGSNYDKHTKARPGRASEKKRQHESWNKPGQPNRKYVKPKK